MSLNFQFINGGKSRWRGGPSPLFNLLSKTFVFLFVHFVGHERHTNSHKYNMYNKNTFEIGPEYDGIVLKGAVLIEQYTMTLSTYFTLTILES